MKRFVSVLLVFCLMVSFSIEAFSTEDSLASSEEETRAMDLFNTGKYTEAKKIFDHLGMTELVKECDYQWTFTQVEQNHFQNSYLFRPY